MAVAVPIESIHESLGPARRFLRVSNLTTLETLGEIGVQTAAEVGGEVEGFREAQIGWAERGFEERGRSEPIWFPCSLTRLQFFKRATRFIWGMPLGRFLS